MVFRWWLGKTRKKSEVSYQEPNPSINFRLLVWTLHLEAKGDSWAQDLSSRLTWQLSCHSSRTEFLETVWRVSREYTDFTSSWRSTQYPTLTSVFKLTGGIQTTIHPQNGGQISIPLYSCKLSCQSSFSNNNSFQLSAREFSARRKKCGSVSAEETRRCRVGGKWNRNQNLASNELIRVKLPQRRDNKADPFERWSFLIWELTQGRRQRQRRNQKTMIWLAEWGKIIVLHVRHAL